MKALPARERLVSILRSRRVWNLSSPPRPRRSRTMPVTLPDSSSQRMPFQEEGHVVVDSASEVVVHDSRRFCGSAVIPFLNSSRDRTSGRDAEQVPVRRVRKRRRQTGNNKSNNLGEEFIGVNVDGNRKERERERERGTLGGGG